MYLRNLICVLVLVVFAGCGSGSNLRDKGLAALKKGDYKEAIIHLEKARLKMPNSATIFCNLGVAYWHDGRLDDSLDALAEAARMKPDDSRPLEFTGWVYVKKGDWKKAKESFEQADALTPKSPRILTAKAMAEAHVGEVKYAVAYLTEALQYDADYPPALYNLGLLLRDHTLNIDKAASYFRKYLKVADDDKHAEIAQEFLDSLDRAAADATKTEIKVGLAKARDQVRDGENVRALIILKGLAEKASDNADVMWEMAVVYDKHLEYPEKAKETYSNFRKLFPDDPRNRSVEDKPKPVVADKPEKKPVVEDKPEPKPVVVDKPTEAPRPAVKASSTDIRKASAAFSKGKSLYDAKNWDGAVVQYEKALELHSKFKDAAFNLGLAYKFKGDLEKSRHAFEYAIHLDPESVKSHYMLGVLYYNDLKDVNKAMRHAVAALEIKEDYARAHHLMALIWQSKAKDRPDLAIKHFKRCIELVPKNDPLAKRAKLSIKSLSKLKL